MGTYLSAHVTELDAAASALYGSPSDFADVLEDFEVPGGVGPTDPEGPGAQGPCAYETVAGSTSRTVDGSSLSLDVYRPTDAGGPAPVVIFNPGTQLDSEEYAASIEHMASWCYVVVANGRSYSPLSGDSDEEWTSDIEDMVAFARSGGGPVGSDVVDGSRIALVGHSAGAKNSFRALAAGPSLADAIVAWDVSGRNPPLEAVDSLEAPVLLLGERFNAENSTLGMPCAPENQNFEAYFDALPMDLPTLLVEFQNADHMSWLDSRECGLECDLCPTNDAFDASRFQRRSRGFTVAFLETMLRGDDRFESYLFGADMDSEVAAGGLVVQQK
jgi:dienelactone hydrolase